MGRIDMTFALNNPSEDELLTLIHSVTSSAALGHDYFLWKVGGCFQDLLGNRPFDTCHYNPEFFNTAGAICLAYNLSDKARAAYLESSVINYTKNVIQNGINTKGRDD